MNGGGAFRPLKDELHGEYAELLESWYAFRDDRAHGRAVAWLLEHDLATEEAARRFGEEHPEAPVP